MKNLQGLLGWLIWHDSSHCASVAMWKALMNMSDSRLGSHTTGVLQASFALAGVILRRASRASGTILQDWGY